MQDCLQMGCLYEPQLLAGSFLQQERSEEKGMGLPAEGHACTRQTKQLCVTSRREVQCLQACAHAHSTWQTQQQSKAACSNACTTTHADKSACIILACTGCNPDLTPSRSLVLYHVIGPARRQRKYARKSHLQSKHPHRQARRGRPGQCRRWARGWCHQRAATPHAAQAAGHPACRGAPAAAGKRQMKQAMQRGGIMQQ